MEAIGGDLQPDLTAPCIVHRVQAKFGFSEVHVPAPGFAEHVRIFAVFFYLCVFWSPS